MNAQDKRRTEAALRMLCVGTQIVGARWYAHNFFIALEPVTPHPHREQCEVVLSVESRWTVFPARPEHYPTAEAELPDLSLEERLIALARLADQDIVAVSLGEDAPHLILTFDSGCVFFLNGAHAAYELRLLPQWGPRGLRVLEPHHGHGRARQEMADCCCPWRRDRAIQSAGCRLARMSPTRWRTAPLWSL